VAHRREMKSHALMVNLDSMASALGHTVVLVAGSPQLESWVIKNMNAAKMPPRIVHEVTPFADHFPFTIFDVPAIWFYRPNFGNIRWQHHGPADTLENCSPEAVCRILNALTPMAAQVGDSRVLPFKGGINPKERPEINHYAQELFDIKV
jgi:hypothetical protein